MSRLPSTANTSSAAHACTGGFTSPKSHSYAGSAPQWKARSQAANQGYSHLSGIDMMSNASKWRHRELRPVLRAAAGGGCAGSPSSQRATS